MPYSEARRHRAGEKAMRSVNGADAGWREELRSSARQTSTIRAAVDVSLHSAVVHDLIMSGGFIASRGNDAVTATW